MPLNQDNGAPWEAASYYRELLRPDTMLLHRCQMKGSEGQGRDTVLQRTLPSLLFLPAFPTLLLHLFLPLFLSQSYTFATVLLAIVFSRLSSFAASCGLPAAIEFDVFAPIDRSIDRSLSKFRCCVAFVVYG